jgi:polysaccharide biosynthesis transport protein
MSESKLFAEDEVNLQHYLDGIWRRRWTILLTTLAALAVGYAVTALTTPIYQAQAKLLVRAGEFPQRALSGDSSPVDLLATTPPESLDTQIELLRSRPFLQDVFAASQVLGAGQPVSVGITNMKGTNLVAVTVESPDRRVAARVANTLVDQFIQRTSVLSLQEITQARAFVQREALKAEQALQRAEDALMRVRRSNRVTELNAEQASRTADQIRLESSSRETYGSIVRVKAQIRAIRSELARQPEQRLVARIQENPRVGALQSKLAEATIERETLLRSYRPGSLKMRVIDAQIETLRAQLGAEPAELRVYRHVPNLERDQLLSRLGASQLDLQGLEAQHAQLEAQAKEQRRQIATTQREIDQFGPWEALLAQRQRERDMAEKSYLRLAGKLEDLQIQESAHHVSARVVERALPPGSPVRPHRTTNLAMALALGLLLGCSLAFLLESLDDRITTPEEIDRLLGLPVLGYIPAIAGDRRLLHRLPPHSPVAESYRGLRSSIRFSTVDPPLRTLALSSARAGEGKSTSAINLAFAMVMDGRRVILVDTDLRQPSLHRLLDLRSSPGLTDVLAGQCSLDDAVQAVAEHELLVLTSGPIPPNPAEMLNTAEMEALIRQLQERADLVIFDTPPCVPFTDAQVLGTKLGGVLLVAEIGTVRQAEVRRAREVLDQAHIRVLGVVSNKILHQRTRYYHRHSYYRNDFGDDGPVNGGGNGHRAEARSPRALSRLDGAASNGPDERPSPPWEGGEGAS